MPNAVAAPTPVRERPILFSGPMVRAILDGRKTQTRRVVTDSTSCGNYPPSCCEMTSSLVFVDPGPSPAGNPGPYLHAPVAREHDGTDASFLGIVERIYPRWWVGDRLWVRETLRGDGQPGDRRVGITRYGADGEMVLPCCRCGWVRCICIERSANMDVVWQWKRHIRPSIHMPRWASRLTLEITDVRVERLQEISEDDAIAEGIEVVNRLVVRPDTRTIEQSPRIAFRGRWDSINAKRGYGWDANPWLWCLTFTVVPQ